MLNHASQSRVASSGSDLAHKQKLRQLVSSQLNRQRHFQTTVDLIDSIIDTYPDCPRFASLMVDRLLVGDEALADALRQGGF